MLLFTPDKKKLAHKIIIENILEGFPDTISTITEEDRNISIQIEVSKMFMREHQPPKSKFHNAWFNTKSKPFTNHPPKTPPRKKDFPLLNNKTVQETPPTNTGYPSSFKQQMESFRTDFNEAQKKMTELEESIVETNNLQQQIMHEVVKMKSQIDHISATLHILASTMISSIKTNDPALSNTLTTQMNQMHTEFLSQSNRKDNPDHQRPEIDEQDTFPEKTRKESTTSETINSHNLETTDMNHVLD